LKEVEEKSLLLKLAEFGEVIEKAGTEYKPNFVVRWCLELAKHFNNYYHKYKILGEDESLQAARLALVTAVSIGLKNGLTLLGIEVLEEM
jgi:arginyl-tRNA synthetase